MNSFDDRLFDLMLEEGAAKAGIQFADELDKLYMEYSVGPEIKPSFKFRFRMWRLCRKQRKRKSPYRLATALLAFLIVVGSTLTAASALGIDIFKIFERITEVFTFTGTPSKVINEEKILEQLNIDGDIYLPAYIPRDYLFDKAITIEEGYYGIEYVNSEGEILLFSIQKGYSYTGRKVDNENVDTKLFNVDGMAYARVSRKNEYVTVSMYNTQWYILIEGKNLSNETMISIAQRMKYWEASAS